MPKINIFEFLELCYMSWDFWVGVIIGAMVGYAFCKLISLREYKQKNKELEEYRKEIQALKKEISELKISNAFSEYYAGRDKK